MTAPDGLRAWEEAYRTSPRSLTEPVDRLQRWLLRWSEWQLLAASGVLCVVYLGWGNPVRLVMGMPGPEYEQAPRMAASWIAALIAAAFVLTRLAGRQRHQ
jgi:hypothetical protein